MRHSRARLYVNGYSRDELSAAVRGRLEAHLASCADCALSDQKAASFQPFLAQLARQTEQPGFERALENVRRGALAGVRREQARTTAFPLLAWARPLMSLSTAVPVALGAALILIVLLGPRNGSELRSPGDAGRFAAVGKGGAHGFTMIRDGSEVRIEWSRNGRREHRVRKAPDPVSVRVAGGQLVRGNLWSDAQSPRPGQVTYYLID